MAKNYSKMIFALALFAGLLLVLNFFYYRLLDTAMVDSFTYPLAVVYGFFFILSVAILSILIYINKTNKDQLGYAFLFLTAAKMAISYFMARPIILKGEDSSTEKFNFFIVFIVFLVVEAYYTARLLNNKQ